MSHMQKQSSQKQSSLRKHVVVFVMLSVIFVLVLRAFDLHVNNHGFLQKQGDARHLRTVDIAAHRGNIYDRNGEALAISTPVDSIWAQPDQLASHIERVDELASLLKLDADNLKHRVRLNEGREFMYIKRRIQPSVSQRVLNLEIKGVALQREYKRFYPTGEVTAHILGFTDVDDNGQEGIELAYNKYLSGTPGAKKILRDRLGRTVKDVELIRSAEPGEDIHLSIDKRLQYLTYRALKSAVKKHNAKAASAVLLDVKTGEVLAMANQPSFNPNNRLDMHPSRTRNRAMTDLFEPGSTIKPFVIAAALDSGKWHSNDVVNTSPGYMRVQGNSIKDVRNYGKLSLTGIITKSSNVGISKVALSLSPEQQWHTYHNFGLGISTGSGFPGEANGQLDLFGKKGDFERATLAFGYGLSITNVQLARAYSVFASDGVIKPISFIRTESPVEGERVVSRKISRSILKMMEHVVSPQGTANLARVPNYRVAGKTGTTHKSINGGYSDDKYQAIFAGIAPLDNPELVMVVTVDEPRNKGYYGGKVAAPVFSEVISGAMRLLDVTPDKLMLGDSGENLVSEHAVAHSNELGG